MPPKGKGESGKGKGKGKGKQPRVPQRKSPRKEAAPTEEPPSTDEENNHGAESDASQETATKSQTQNSKRRRKEAEFPIETLKKIAAFYEGNPMFYDVSHESYKDNHVKDTKLLELSAEINVPVEDIVRHFTNMRTDHFKLKNTVKTTPSGSGAAKILTPLQHLKVHGYSFLDRFYRPRNFKTDTCGTIDGTEDGNESGSDAESVAAEEANPGTSKGTSKSKSKSSAKSSGVQDVLLKFLEKSAESTKQAAEKVQAMKDASQRPERAVWADWLVSIQSEIPENLYRQYQADSFALAMRYISGQVQSTSQPQPQQLVQPQLSTLPQQQYINLSAIPPRGHQQQLQFAPQIQYSARAHSATAPVTTSDSQLYRTSPNVSLLNQAWNIAETMTSPIVGTSLPPRTSDIHMYPTQQSVQSTESLSQLLHETQSTLQPSDDVDRNIDKEM